MKSIKIWYDDQAGDIITKINALLEEQNLVLSFDNEEHDGFDVISLNQLEPKS